MTSRLARPSIYSNHFNIILGISAVEYFMKEKKKSKSTSKRQTFKRSQRLQSAKGWVGSYIGKSLVRGYRKRFRVDLLTAIAELKMLGADIDPQYEHAIRLTVSNLTETGRKKKEAHSTLTDYQNEAFAYIIGHTSGGAPYGLRWDELPACDDQDE